MPTYTYVGSEPRSFPTLGIGVVGPGESFDTEHPVANALVVDADGNPTDVDADGNPVGDPRTNADPDPNRGLVLSGTEGSASELVADYTLEDLTKAELLDLAHDLDLHGRSQMTKPELIAALREAALTTPEDQAAAEAAGQTAPVAGEGDDTSTEE